MNATAGPAVQSTHGLHLAWNTADPVEVRRRIRAGRYRGHTGGLARGCVQANLAILPAGYADEFARFCQRNPKPCPLLAMSEPGSPRLPELAADLDLRTDVPSYRVFRNGDLDGDVAGIGALWRDDFVAFALGCSFSFEEALVDAGLSVRHWKDGSVCPMYLTDVECVPAGRFRGRLVVSMRPFTPADASRRCRSRAGTRACTARRSISACRNASGSTTSGARGRATIPSSPPARCRSSGPAA